MPVMKCQRDGKDGYKCGKNGHCFTGKTARKQAAFVCSQLDETEEATTDFVLEAQGEGGGCKIPIRGAGGLFAGCAVAFKGNTLAGQNNFPTRIGQRGYQRTKLRSTKSQVSGLPATLRTKISLAKQAQFVLRRTDRQVKELLQSRLPNADIPQINTTTLSQELITLSQEFSPANRSEAVARFLGSHPELGPFNVSVKDFQDITDRNLPNSKLAINDDLLKKFEDNLKSIDDTFAGDLSTLELAKTLQFGSSDIELNYVNNEIAGVRSRIIEALSKRNAEDAIAQIEEFVTFEFDDDTQAARLTDKLTELYQILPTTNNSVVIQTGGTPNISKVEDTYYVDVGELGGDDVAVNPAVNGDLGYDAAKDFLFHAYGHIHEDTLGADNTNVLGYQTKSEVDQSVYPFEDSEIPSRILRHQHEYIGREYDNGQSEVTAFALSSLSSPKKLLDADTELTKTAIATLDSDAPLQTVVKPDEAETYKSQDFESEEAFFTALEKNSQRFLKTFDQLAELDYQTKISEQNRTKAELDAKANKDPEIQELTRFLLESTEFDNSTDIQSRLNKLLARKFPDEYTAYVTAKRDFQETNLKANDIAREIISQRRVNDGVPQYTLDSGFSDADRVALINNLKDAYEFIPQHGDDFIFSVVPGNTPGVTKVDDGIYQITAGNLSTSHLLYGLEQASFDSSPVEQLIQERLVEKNVSYCRLRVSEAESVLEAVGGSCQDGFNTRMAKFRNSKLSIKETKEAVLQTPFQSALILEGSGLPRADIPETFPVSKRRLVAGTLSMVSAAPEFNLSKTVRLSEVVPMNTQQFKDRAANISALTNLEQHRPTFAKVPNKTNELVLTRKIEGNDRVAVARVRGISTTNAIALQTTFNSFLSDRLRQNGVSRENLFTSQIAKLNIPTTDQIYGGPYKLTPLFPSEGKSIRLTPKNLLNGANLKRLTNNPNPDQQSLLQSYYEANLLFGNLNNSFGTVHQADTGETFLLSNLAGEGFLNKRNLEFNEDDVISDARLDILIDRQIDRAIRRGEEVEGQVYTDFDDVPNDVRAVIGERLKPKLTPNFLDQIASSFEALEPKSFNRAANGEEFVKFLNNVRDQISTETGDEEFSPRDVLVQRVLNEYQVALRDSLKDPTTNMFLQQTAITNIDDFVSAEINRVEREYETYLSELDEVLVRISNNTNEKLASKGLKTTNAGDITEQVMSSALVGQPISNLDRASLTSDQQATVDALTALSRDVPQEFAGLLGISDGEYKAFLDKGNARVSDGSGQDGIRDTSGRIPNTAPSIETGNQWVTSVSQNKQKKLERYIQNAQRMLAGASSDALPESFRNAYTQDLERMGSFLRDFQSINDDVTVGLGITRPPITAAKSVDGVVPDYLLRPTVSLNIDELGIRPNQPVPVVLRLSDSEFVVETNNTTGKSIVDAESKLVRIKVDGNNVQATPYQVPSIRMQDGKVVADTSDSLTFASAAIKEQILGYNVSLKAGSDKIRSLSLGSNFEEFLVNPPANNNFSEQVKNARVEFVEELINEFSLFIQDPKATPAQQRLTLNRKDHAAMKAVVDKALADRAQEGSPVVSFDDLSANNRLDIIKAALKQSSGKAVPKETTVEAAVAQSGKTLEIFEQQRNNIDLIKLRTFVFADSFPYLKMDAGVANPYTTNKVFFEDSFLPDLSNIDNRVVNPANDAPFVRTRVNQLIDQEPDRLREGLQTVVRELGDEDLADELTTASPGEMKDVLDDIANIPGVSDNIYRFMYSPNVTHLTADGEIILNMRDLDPESPKTGNSAVTAGKSISLRLAPGDRDGILKRGRSDAFAVTFTDSANFGLRRNYIDGTILESLNLLKYMFEQASEELFLEFVEEGEWNLKQAEDFLSDEIDLSSVQEVLANVY